MVGVFIVMWLAALMSLAASGMQHRQLATRFMAYANDRVVAFAAADSALLVARDRLTYGEQAAEIATATEFEAGPHGVLGASYRGHRSEVNRAAGWLKVDWNGNTAVMTADKARYFIERIAFSGYVPDAETAREARESPLRRYRVSAMGCGELPGTRVFLQAIYEVRPLRVQPAGSGVASTSFKTRQLNWREVVAWHDNTTVTFAPGTNRERCDA
ncbi:hypothetical protein [Pandoraea sp. NPDC087047]|uniref:pilus assembly PilX family protein n=1 Tax=Pandoraea sp. NPDC087047 TaxID=3364390 RepID=UPI00380D6B0A